jgi:heme/copper-type cytochrome/quinol oxidase subunit 2
MSKAWFGDVITSIEAWASQRDDRVQLLMVMIWVALGVIALTVIAIIAVVMLPPEVWSL